MRACFTIIFLISCLIRSSAQLQVDTTQPVESLIRDVFVGDGVKVGNITSNTHKSATGQYQCPDNKTGIRQGILLSTGLATSAIGPNTSPGISTALSPSTKKYKSDKSLVDMAHGEKVFDVTCIEFDFIPLHNKVVFEYAFGSEEYKEYVGSPFNDVFGFFITGGDMDQKNEALLPNDKKFVAINNINQKFNKQLYIDNDPFVNAYLFKKEPLSSKAQGNAKPNAAKTSIRPTLKSRQHIVVTDSAGQAEQANDTALFYVGTANKKHLDETMLRTFQYDGFTKKMKAQFYVTPYEKYHIKIAIGDVDDLSFDSGVFLEKGSFRSFRDTTQKRFQDYEDRSARLNFDSIMKYQSVVVKPSVEPHSQAPSEAFEKRSVYFDDLSFALPDTCQQTLDELVSLMQGYPRLQLWVTGVIENGKAMGKTKFLAEQRSESVMLYLQKQNITRARMHFTPYVGPPDKSHAKTTAAPSNSNRLFLDLRQP